MQRTDFRHHLLGENIDVTPTEHLIFQTSHHIINPNVTSGNGSIPKQDFSRAALSTLNQERVMPHCITCK